MPKFKYTAAAPPNADIVHGTIEAPSKEIAKQQLRRKRLQIISLKRDWTSLDLSRNRINPVELVIFTRQLATMARAGIPLNRALKIMIEQTNSKYFAAVLEQALVDVESGEQLSAALRRYPNVFNTLYINMLIAGEISGENEDILKRLADFIERSNELKKQVISALSYPAVILCVAFVAVLALYYFVIPQFEGLFASVESIPLTTRLNITASRLLREHPFVFFGLLGGIITGIVALFKNSATRYLIDRHGLKLPLFGPVIQKTAIARFARTLSTLLSAGVDLLEALALTADTSGNMVIHKAINDARKSISSGAPISRALKETGQFPSMVVHMVQVGEESGAVDEMLLHVAEHYEEDVKATLNSLVKTLEPLMIVGLGIVVGGILVSIYVPMFASMMQAAQ